MAGKQTIKLRCNLCDLYRSYTDELWLRSIRGRDYLVCEEHQNSFQKVYDIGEFTDLNREGVLYE